MMKTQLLLQNFATNLLPLLENSFGRKRIYINLSPSS